MSDRAIAAEIGVRVHSRAGGTRCHRFALSVVMQKVAEYQQHALECRAMAVKTRDPLQKQQLEEMAEAWAMPAREREKLLLKRATNSNSIVPE